MRLTAVAALAVFAFACADGPVEAPTEQPNFSVAPSEFAAGEGDMPLRHMVVFSSAGALPAKFAARVEEAGGVVDASYSEFGVATVSGLDDRGAQAVSRIKGVRYVELEPVVELELPELGGEPEVLGAAPQSQDNPAGAFFFSQQWHLRAIAADQAWAAGRLGSPAVTVAILDTGIDYLHGDLVGLVDLSRSASFVAFDDFLTSIFFPTRHPVTDLHWHGTHVASTVSSLANAAAGVTSQVTLMGVKVCSVSSSVACPGTSIFDGFVYAVANGADVINMSLGGSFTKKDYPGFVSAINRLFNYAKQNGVTVVVSAGNTATDLDHDGNGFKTYCNAPHVACISATGPASSDHPILGDWYDVDTPASYTNFGRSAINVAAPGGTGAGFVAAACSSSSLVVPICGSGGIWIIYATGTSMAAPHASGVAALLVEDLGRNPGRIVAKLQQTADDLGQPGTDPFYGKGRLNAAAAAGVN
jgi:subtilisin family serine protease